MWDICVEEGDINCCHQGIRGEEDRNGTGDINEMVCVIDVGR